MGAIGAVPAGRGVVDGAIPYQPSAAEQKQKNFEQRMVVDPWNRDIGDPLVKCYLPGVPRATYLPFPFQIVQGADEITIAYEFSSATRIIHLRDHAEPAIDSWMGWSNGSWDGDTLVVDVTGFNGNTWFDRAGNFHSNALHVVERYTPVTPYHLDYEVIIEDPERFRAALDDAHAAVPPDGRGRAGDGVQVSRVRGAVAARLPQQPGPVTVPQHVEVHPMRMERIVAAACAAGLLSLSSGAGRRAPRVRGGVRRQPADPAGGHGD